MSKSIVVLLLVGLGCSTTVEAQDLGPSQAPDGFWEHWGDGQAEIATYSLTQPRYGEARAGEAVLIFVTETFAEDNRVKSNGGHAVEYPVLKLNEVRDFNTGIYDYNVMTSSFVRVDSGSAWGQPVKVSFSSQEWCGHVYEQLIVRDGEVERTSHSYFDGEADRADTVAIPARAVFEDTLPILIRGLVGGPHTPTEIQVLDRSIDARFAHQQASFKPATLTWGEAESVEVPLGVFEARPVVLDRASGVDVTYWVEVAAPHRIVRWTRTDGEEGQLVAAVRTPYWSQHGNTDLPARATIGLPPREWAR